ncbi:MAG: hypothetical protein KGZ67_04340 [Hydrogenophaga sp.]|jgi:hypothetical protein|nr:hypothetical protein [Hydrogenophaga sp.]
MLPTGNNLSALFRTLAPEESKFEAAVAATTPSAGQEWPLFKVVAPTRPEPTPPLTPQERKRWGVQDTVRAETPKPVLSMSGLSSKLAQSLTQISERMVSEAAQPPTRTMTSAAAEPPLGRLSPHAPGSAAAAQVRASLFSKLAPAMEPDVDEERENVVGLFAKATTKAPSIPDKAQVDAKADADDSLSQIFSRLDVKEKAAVKPVEKRSSLSTRLGKR